MVVIVQAVGRVLCLVVVAAGGISVTGLLLAAAAQASDGLSDAPAASVAYRSVSAGGLHSCAIRADDTIVCWGNNVFGQADPPDGSYTAVTAGEFHSCGLRTDGSVTCWGRTQSYIMPPSDGVGNCVLRSNGTVTCWPEKACWTWSEESEGGGRLHGHVCWDSVGLPGELQSDPDRWQVCMWATHGAVTCWGRYSDDPPAGIYKAVSSGFDHICAIRADDSVACWGDSMYGQAHPPDGRYMAVAVGRSHSCGLRTNGAVTCWGDNTFGQADPPAGIYQSVTAGDRHSCALDTDGTITCWGEAYGETPTGVRWAATDPTRTTTEPDPTPNEASVAYRSVSAGGLHSCAIRADDTIVCWGNNVFGQADPPDGSYTAVTAGEFQSCGLRTDGSVTCWGRNNLNNLLINYLPTPPPDGSYTAVSAGFRACAVRTDGTVTCWPAIKGSYCWSVDRENGHPDHVHVCWDPDESLNRSYRAIAVAGRTECGLRTDGGITCWGLSNSISNSISNSYDPPAGTYKAVSAGIYHICAIRADDSVACWGDSMYGQAHPPDGRYMAVAVGRSHSCGLRTNGAVTCWGSNTFGQADPPAGIYQSVTAGDRHSCALDTDGTITCWGEAYGETPTGVRWAATDPTRTTTEPDPTPNEATESGFQPIDDLTEASSAGDSAAGTGTTETPGPSSGPNTTLAILLTASGLVLYTIARIMSRRH